MNSLYYSNELNKLLLKLKDEIKNKFGKCKKIAIKIHFGEPGNDYAFKPEQIEPIIRILKELRISYFLIDTPVAYSSPRSKAPSYKKAAVKKGWGELGEVIISNNYTMVKGRHLNYEVCMELTKADGVLVITHVKGHACSGFGGAIKNLGMGALSSKSKNTIHDGGKPAFNGKCNECKACERSCPINKLKVFKRPIFTICYGCSNCAYACPIKSIKPKVNYFDTLLADGANTAQSQFKKFYYVSFMMNITKECDCERNPKGIIAKDCGYLIGNDAVAIDNAAHDMITKENRGDVFLKFNKKSGLEQIKAAEKLGMGSSEYKIVKI